jgi:hypothetical protein
MLFRSTLSPKDNAIIDDLLERSLGRKKWRSHISMTQKQREKI